MKPALMPAWLHHLSWIASLLLYVVALCMPALAFRHTGRNDLEMMPGILTLMMGWLVLFKGQMAWLANIQWFISMLGVFLKIPYLALIPAAMALLTSLHMFQLFGVKLAADEAGMNHLYLERILPGAWIWYAALAVPFLWSIAALILRGRSPAPALS